LKIGFVSRREDESVRLLKSLVDHFKAVAEIYVEPDIAQRIGVQGTPVEEMEEKGVDLVVSIGGDGTILRALRCMRDPIPILGVNMGTLGFLVDVQPKDAVRDIEHILGGFDVDDRTRLTVTLDGKDFPPATNEVAMITASPAKMMDFSVTVDGSILEALRADGMIFATPTGSTAYAMSAGGPIVDPRVDAIVLVPVAPFKLYSRPWVIPGGSTVEVNLKSPEKDAVVVVDGQNMATISSANSVAIRRAKTPARFVKASLDGFYEKVKNKLI
jgi:NAD+ kinase